MRETAPVNGTNQTIPWWLHMLVHKAYAKRFPGQSAERVADRGGFYWEEIIIHIRGNDSVSAYSALKEEIREANK